MLKPITAVLTVLSLAACGSTQAPTSAPMPAAETSPPMEPATPDFGTTFTDAGGVRRAKLDPALVKVTQCQATVDDYGGGDVYRGAKARFQVKNTSALRGTVALTVQYQAGDGTAVTEGNPGANNIRPGQTAIVTDSVGADKGDLPRGKVRCEVVKAEVYVPTE